MSYEGTIIDHGSIRSTADLNKLDIIDFNRYRSYWKNPQHCLEILTSHLAGLIYTVIETNLLRFPERDDFPGWCHVGNHEEVGKVFWNYFHCCFKGELHFHDSPDFSGRIFHGDDHHRRYGITQYNFYGDVGKVSPIAMMESMSSTRRCSNTLWVSVSDNCQRLTILEPTLTTENLQMLRQKLTPVLKENTAHVLYGNVFIERERDNIYVGDDTELMAMPVSQIRKRISAALTGTWKRHPVPQAFPEENTMQSDFQPETYAPQSLWENL